LRRGPDRSSDLLQARYDETPYRDQCFEHLDLAKLLGMARLFGLDAPTEPIRVLDLACASGLHIRTQAERHPGAHFTGVDFASTDVEAGRKAAIEAGLENVELMTADLREFEVPAESFDVVLCCGAFSWVPDDVKERVLELCRTALRPTGVGAIAYLTYPGWKQREAVRELLSFRVRDVDEPQQRVVDSALMLRLLHAGYSAQEQNPHAQSLLEIVEAMQQSPANAFVHDELGEIHDPCYFMHFVEWCAEWGLQYVAEADLGTMALAGLPETTVPLLTQLAPDFLETQQLIDFMVNRSGRTSLIVRSDAPVGRDLSPDCLDELCFRTPLVDVTPVNAPADVAVVFETPHGRRLEIEDGLGGHLLRDLQQAESGRSLADLEAAAEAASLRAPDVREALLELIARGHVDPLAAIG
jgi:ubiquinone/menaquinone biosynthesis C-methylase UbiE